LPRLRPGALRRDVLPRHRLARRPGPARIYIPELLGHVPDGAINRGRVFDNETDLDHIAGAYRAMDERRAIKSLFRTGAV
jgi:hypothetical protein